MQYENLALLVAGRNERGIIDAQETQYKEEAQKVVEALNKKYSEENLFPQRDKIFNYLLEHEICGKDLIELYEKSDKDIDKMIKSLGDLK